METNFWCDSFPYKIYIVCFIEYTACMRSSIEFLDVMSWSMRKRVLSIDGAEKQPNRFFATDFRRRNWPVYVHLLGMHPLAPSSQYIAYRSSCRIYTRTFASEVCNANTKNKRFTTKRRLIMALVCVFYINSIRRRRPVLSGFWTYCGAVYNHATAYQVRWCRDVDKP